MTPLRTLFSITTAGLAVSATSLPAQVVDGQLFGSWKMDCTSGACQAFLNVSDISGNTVASLSLLSNADNKQATLVLGTPEMVALPPGTQISVADSEPLNVPFQFCGSATCTAIAVLDDNMQAAMSGQDVMQVTYVIYGQQNPISYTVPIDGFADAVAALQE